MPALAGLRLVLAELLARLSRLLFERVQGTALEHASTLFSQSCIKANFTIVFTVPIALHHANVLPSLPGAVEIAHTDEIELLILEAQADLFRLLNA